MESYLARQPIFNAALEVIAYEILFRSGLENTFQHNDPNQASGSVLSDSFMNVGLDSITDNRLAFINFTRDLLLGGLAEMFPPDRIVVEILETVEPDEEVLAACKNLHGKGYFLALDDFQYQEAYAPIFPMISIIKVDFSLSDKTERAWLMESLGRRLGIRMLAEKIETYEEFLEAKALGYTYFQGYFFCRPLMIANQRIPESKIASLRLLQELHRPHVEIHQLEDIIKTDISMSYKLLRYVNSAFFGLRHEVHSLRQALSLLGLRNIKKWATLLSLARLGEEKSPELVCMSLIRARFAELLVAETHFAQQDQDAFLVGMFSLLDALVDMPMDVVISDIPLAEDIKDALLGKENSLRAIRDLILAYERTDIKSFEHARSTIGIPPDRVPMLYLDSVEWAQAILRMDAAAASKV